MDSPSVWELEQMPEDVRAEARLFKRGMSPTHVLMAEWVVQNPGGKLREMGAFFGYSISWLSQIMNSDMFKAHLAGRLKEIQAVVTQSVPQKMELLAKLACERMTEVLENTTDHEIIQDGFDKVMHRFGYAPNSKTGIQPQGPAIGQQNNIFYLNPSEFQKVQGQLINAHGERPALEHKPSPEMEDVKLTQQTSVKAV